MLTHTDIWETFKMDKAMATNDETPYFIRDNGMDAYVSVENAVEPNLIYIARMDAYDTGMGYGTAFIQKLKSFALDNGYEGLFAYPENERSLNFFIKNGFTKEPQDKDMVFLRFGAEAVKELVEEYIAVSDDEIGRNALLQTRLRLISKQIEAEPENATLKARKKIVQRMIDNQLKAFILWHVDLSKIDFYYHYTNNLSAHSVGRELMNYTEDELEGQVLPKAKVVLRKDEVLKKLLAKFVDEVCAQAEIKEGRITLYRAISLIKTPDQLEKQKEAGVFNELQKEMGNCWAFNIKSAETYNSGSYMFTDAGFSYIILRGSFKLEDIDWTESFDLYLVNEFMEHEIRPIKGRSPVVLDIAELTEADQKKAKTIEWKPLNPSEYKAEKGGSLDGNYHTARYEQGGPANFDKVASASSRFKPKELIVFEPALIGTNGNKLISYEWSYDWIEEPNWEGELKPKRKSDWNNAEISADTGRDIVHKYTVQLSDGELKTVSSESVPILLGYLDRKDLSSFANLATAAKTLAKQQMKLAIMEAQLKEYQQLRDKFEKEPKPEIIEIDEPVDFVRESREQERYNVYAMGDVWRRQDNHREYTNDRHNPTKFIKKTYPERDTIENLTAEWVSKRIADAGGKYPTGIRDLKNRVERQKRRVSQILQQEKKERGGLFESGQVHPGSSIDDLITLGQYIKKKIRTNEAFALLDSDKELSGSDWGAGACYPLAQAIQGLYGGELKVIKNSENIVKHVMVKIGEGYFDDRGFGSDKLKLHEARLYYGPTEKYYIDDFKERDLGAIGRGTKGFVDKVKNILSIPKFEDGNLINFEIFGREDFDSEDPTQWFGDLKNAKKDVEIFEAERLRGNDRKSAIRWLKENLQGHSYENDDTGFRFYLSDDGISKSTSGKHEDYDVLVSAFKLLPKIVKAARLGYDKPDDDNNPDILRVYKLFGCIKSQKDFFAVRITVKKIHDSERGKRGQYIYKLYSYLLVKIKNPDSFDRSSSFLGATTSCPVSGFTTKVMHLLVKTKPYDLIYIPSQIVDAQYAPLVCYHGTTNKGYGSYNYIYFSSERDYALKFIERKGDLVLSYINIRSPFVIEATHMGYGEIVLNNRIIGFYRELQPYAVEMLKGAGYDGIIVNYGDRKKLEVIPFTREQIRRISVEPIVKTLALGGSVDSDILWHGSKNKELIFGHPKEGSDRKSNMQLDFGTHFTNQEYASFYSGEKGKLYPARIELKSPLDLTKAIWYSDEPDFQRVHDLIIALGLQKGSFSKIAFSYYDKDGIKHNDIQSVAITANMLDSLVPKRVVTALKQFGYDGLIYTPYHPAGGSGGMRFISMQPKSYIVLDESAINPVKEMLEAGGGIKAYHGTYNEAGLDRDRNDLIWFSDSKKIADQYRRRSIFSNEVDWDKVMSDEDSENITESDSAIDVVSEEQGIDLAKGKIYEGRLLLSNPLDLTEYPANIDDVEVLWNDLKAKGLVGETWEEIDPEFQDEIRDNFEGKTIWKLLEGENTYQKAKGLGYDAIIINDVGVDGRPHVSYGVFGISKFEKLEQGGPVEVFYRAEMAREYVPVKTINPTGYYEKVGNNNAPVFRAEEYAYSKIPETAASKTLTGAILGCGSMSGKFGNEKLKAGDKIQVYGIHQKPDVDISHWSGADFGEIKEVRYRKPIEAKHLYEVTLSAEAVNLINEFYGLKAFQDEQRYDYEMEFPEQLSGMADLVENGKFLPALHKQLLKNNPALSTNRPKYEEGSLLDDNLKNSGKWSIFTKDETDGISGKVEVGNGDDRQTEAAYSRGGVRVGEEGTRESLAEKKINADILSGTSGNPNSAAIGAVANYLSGSEKPDSMAEKAQPVKKESRKAIKPGDKLPGTTTFYRVPSGFENDRKTTAKDLIDFEGREYGNAGEANLARKIAQENNIDLSKVPARELIWVTRTKTHARRYGSDVWDEPINNALILVDDGDNGYLVMKNYDKYIPSNTMESKKIGCKKCGWEWHEADAVATDKYICHKCGHDNTPGKMKDGGRVPFFYEGDSAAGVLIVSAKTGRMLFLLRSSEGGSSGVWAQSGGKLERGESFLQCAIRETEEEIKYKLTVPLHEIYIFRDGDFTYVNFLAIVEDEFEPKLNSEHDAHRWVYLDSMPSPLHPGVEKLFEEVDIPAKIQKLSPNIKLNDGGEIGKDLKLKAPNGKKYELPDNHEPFIAVPKGGANCGNCAFFFNIDKPRCINHYFTAYNGTSELPPNFESLVSDWYTPALLERFELTDSVKMEKKGEYELPTDHNPFMKVRKGGSSCATCKFLSADKKECVNPYFKEYYGQSELPKELDQYCSDWYEPAEKIKKPDGFEAVRGQEPNLTPNPFGRGKYNKFGLGGPLSDDGYERIINSPEFIRWFGNWKNANRDVVGTIIDDRKKISKGLNVLRTWGKNNLVKNKDYPNKDTGLTFTISGAGIEKFTSGEHEDVNLLYHALENLREIIGGALIGFDREDKDGDANVFRVYKLYSCIKTIAGELFSVRMTGKKLANEKVKGEYVYRIYDFRLHKIKNPAGTSGSVAEASTSQPAAGFTTKLRNLFVNTKPYDYKHLPSQVVRNDGKPLIVWHGTRSDDYNFNVFDEDRAWREVGIHFGTHEQALNILKDIPSIARYLQNKEERIRPFFLKILNPLKNVTDKFSWTYDKHVEILNKLGQSVKKSNHVSSTGFGAFDLETKQDILDAYAAKGIDGLIYDNLFEGNGKSYLVFHSNQAKLADGSNTAFDGSNPDIRYKTGGKIVVDKNGTPIKIYSEAEIKARWKKKKNNIAQLSENIQSLRNNVTRMLTSENEKERLVALIIAIQLKTAERIGNNESAEDKHFGVSMFRKKHVDIKGNKIEFTYLGKTGVQQDKSFADEAIADALKQAIKNTPNQFIFTMTAGLKIGEAQVNKFLTDEYGITSKVIRGFLANKYIAEKLKGQTPAETEPERKKQFNEAVKYAAARVGHTPATLKKHYLLPKTEDKFVNGGKINNP